MPAGTARPPAGRRSRERASTRCEPPHRCRSPAAPLPRCWRAVSAASTPPGSPRSAPRARPAGPRSSRPRLTPRRARVLRRGLRRGGRPRGDRGDLGDEPVGVPGDRIEGADAGRTNSRRSRWSASHPARRSWVAGVCAAASVRIWSRARRDRPGGLGRRPAAAAAVLLRSVRPWRSLSCSVTTSSSWSASVTSCVACWGWSAVGIGGGPGGRSGAVAPMQPAEPADAAGERCGRPGDQRTVRGRA